MARASKSLKVRKGDTVEVIAGKDRGKRGVVQRVDATAQRVIVEGVNVIKRHTKARPPQDAAQAARQAQQPQGGVVEKPAAVHVSNVALVDPETKLPARVGFREETDDRGKTVRVRYFKKSRRVETKKSKALRGDAAEAAEKPAKAAPKAKKDAAETAPEKDAD